MWTFMDVYWHRDTRIDKHTYMYTYIHAYIYTYIHTCTDRQTHRHTHTHIHTHTYMDIRTYIHTYIHVYIHTYIHTYNVHTCMYYVLQKHFILLIVNNFLPNSWMTFKFWYYIAEECTILWVNIFSGILLCFIFFCYNAFFSKIGFRFWHISAAIIMYK